MLEFLHECLTLRYRRIPGPYWAIFGSYEVLLVGAWTMEHLLLRRIRAVSDPTGARRQDRSYLWMGVLQFALLQFPVLRAGRWSTLLPRTWTVVGIGAGIALLGLALRLYSIYFLRENFSYVVHVGRGHRLVTTGPYRLVRHPAYLGLLVYFSGLPLVLCDSNTLMIVMVYVGVMVTRRIRREESALKERFGTEYEAWRSRTKLLVPFLL